MKIKRFEASSMSEALRMIKKDFGEEAVILSAKSMKKSSRLLGGKRAKQVIVTAAIDASPAPCGKADADNFKSGIGKPTTAAANHDEGSSKAVSFLERFKPITRTGQRKLQPKLVRMLKQDQTQPQATDPALDQILISQGVDEHLAADLHQKTMALTNKALHVKDELHTALSQVITASNVVGPHSPATMDTRRIMVLVGAAGVGKTTTAAKFAAKQAMQFGGESVAFLTLDDQRIAGQAELERYAHILGIELRRAYHADDIGHELDALGGRRLVVVDTPGMAAHDHAQLEQLRRLVKAISNASVYLVLNADADRAAMDKAVRFFKPLGPDKVIFTKVDWASRYGCLINVPLKNDVPISHFCDSQKVPEGIHVATAEKIAAIVLTPKCESDGQQEDEPVVAVVRSSEDKQMETYYVANRNSDIFHHKSCKSVKRINRDNMVVFQDPVDAMGQQFKPCRMCCSELIISKPVQRLARNYASYR
ncbi:MAG: AAA family ATPase [Desulfobacteraceae bacterium]|jgi:flagellar biosynthesis protein FlhF